MKINKLKKQGLILHTSKVIIIESTIVVPTLYDGIFENVPEELLHRKIDFMTQNSYGEQAIRIFVFEEK